MKDKRHPRRLFKDKWQCSPVFLQKVGGGHPHHCRCLDHARCCPLLFLSLPSGEAATLPNIGFGAASFSLTPENFSSFRVVRCRASGVLMLWTPSRSEACGRALCRRIRRLAESNTDSFEFTNAVAIIVRWFVGEAGT